MATSLPHPVMDWNSSDRAQSFKEFKQLAEIWFKIKDIKKEDQHNYIIIWSGSEGLKIFNTWGLNDTDLRDPTNIWERFSKHIEPPENYRINRLEFLRYRQMESESFDEFFTRCKAKARKCRFRDNDTEEERIIEVIIAGIRYPEVQKTLLAKDESLKINEVYDICRTHEASLDHMTKFTKLDQSTVHMIGRQTQKEDNCRQCGRKHPRNKCPAYHSKCTSCGKVGHWQNMCTSHYKKGNQSNHGSRRHGRSKSRQRSRNRSSYRSRGKSSNENNIDVHAVTEGELAVDFEKITFNTITVIDSVMKTEEKEDDELFATLDIKLPERKGTDLLTAKVDTGAQGNLLPMRVFRRMFPKSLNAEGFPKPGTTTPRRTTLVAYNGSVIPQYGSISITCKFDDGKWQTQDFFVADADGPIILGLPASRSMKIITINCSLKKENKKPEEPNQVLPELNTKEDLKLQYPDRFEGIGQFPGKFHITLKPDAEPVVQPPRKYPIQLKDELKAELDKMEEISVIARVHEPTDWVSALAFSRKQNGKLRICLDPKDLNRATKRTYHKTPTLEEITHKFSGAKVFSKLDARHGYWSIVLDEESSLYTTFNTPFGRYKFLRLPFGLRVSQDIFQEKMDMILEECPGTLGIADDVAVYGKNGEDHDKNLHNLMKVARKYGLIFNLDKCEIKQQRIKFFGCYYDAEGVHPDPEKVEEIHRLTTPTSTVELQQFLGIVQYMAPFIPKLSDHTDCLRALTRKDSEWIWTESHEAAFKHVKSLICSECILTYFNPAEKSVIQVDASMKGIGAALMQNGHVIAYASKALTDAERRYANIERELLAVVFGCTRFHTYIYGSHFIVQSDHKPLENIQHKGLASVPPRLQRMMMRLQPYDYEIVYKPGKEMVLADALSRLNPRPGPQIDLDTTIHTIQISNEKITKMQEATNQDEELHALKEIITNGWPENPKQVPKIVKHYWSCRHELSVDDGLILKGERIIIPEVMKKEALQKIHEGHQGVTKCQLRAKTCIYWTGINKDIEKMVGQCKICQQFQKSQAHEPLLPQEIPQVQWQCVGTDLFHFDGAEHLIIADYYSKFFFVRRMNGQCTSRAVINTTKQIFGEQRIPSKVISDNGPQFASSEYKNFAAEWGFQHVTSSPRYPRSNGLIERTIQTVKNTLIKAKKSGLDSDLALLCLRSTPIDNVVPSPSELLNCRKLRGNLPMKSQNNLLIKDDVRTRLEQRQKIQKTNHDEHCGIELPPFVVGQKVTIQDQRSGEWSPAQIKEVCPEPRSYLVETPNGYVYRRNRQHIRDIQPVRTPRRVTFADERGDDQQSTSESDCCDADNSSTNCKVPKTYTSRYGRVSRRPERLIEMN